MKSRVLILTGLVLLSALGVRLWLGRSPAQDESVSAASATKLPANTGAAAPGSPAAMTRHSVGAVTTPAIDFGARFRSATNYLDFVRETRPAAKAGDPRAQVYLYRALKSCSTDYQYLFKSQRQKRYLSYEEGLQQTVKRLPFRPEYANLVYSRCHGLFDPLDPDVENPDEWLRRAALGMDPLALALTAARASVMTIDLTQSDDAEPVQHPEKVAVVRRQLGTALRSHDPEVMFEAAQVIHLSGVPDAGRETIAAEWMMAACFRGLDCSSSGEIVRGFCLWDPGCQPYETVPDVLQRSVGAGFPAVEARAREINALIDAGKWEELGFGETIFDP